MWTSCETSLSSNTRPILHKSISGRFSPTQKESTLPQISAESRSKSNQTELRVSITLSLTGWVLITSVAVCHRYPFLLFSGNRIKYAKQRSTFVQILFLIYMIYFMIRFFWPYKWLHTKVTLVAIHSTITTATIVTSTTATTTREIEIRIRIMFRLIAH